MKKVMGHKVQRYTYDLYTEWNGDEYITTGKVYDNRKYDPGFSGCHWGDPRLIYAEQINDTCAPAGFWELVDHVGAIDMDECYAEDDD